MDFDRVKQLFMDITGVGAEDFRFRHLISNGILIVRAMLKAEEENLTEDEKGLCENAAASWAAYEFACVDIGRETPVMSENGEVAVRRGSVDFISSMNIYRELAFSSLALAGLIDSSFVFRAV